MEISLLGECWKAVRRKVVKMVHDYSAYCEWNSKHFYSSILGSYVTPILRYLMHLYHTTMPKAAALRVWL